MKKYLSIAGNIGVGKSTLVHMLCEKLGWQPFYEPVVENPYLGDFYRDMSTWSFQSQVFFLAHRLHIHLQVGDHPDNVVLDRSIYEDAEIFAHNLFLQGQFSERDYETYRSLYESLVEFLRPPDLLIYLQASVTTLQQRIFQRKRDYELSISPDYLERLNVLYEKWINGFTLCPVLVIPADDLDYVAHPSHLELILDKIQDRLSGKEEVVF